ncbi:putative B3 domain-containing protein Os03g0621600 [Camellia sinensis]|uniref:putative B3 domain-containing protein Os03g0621600 n=1 Tax=Camellia sinensis TaxID=4442 RepID=UPI0010359A73|nr:putative B3 domain-containing protein Os03g0621600 [Camellia sinensis]
MKMAPRRAPSFFKVLIGDFSNQLRIPPAFKKHFGGSVPQNCIIWSCAEERSWNVNIRKVDDDRLLFHQGWAAFVRDNSLEMGDFLLFRYEGDSQFHVDMYGKNCCQKLAAADPANQTDVLREKIQKKSSAARQRIIRRSSWSIVAAEAKQEKGRGRALEAAEKFMSTSNYPSFIRVMRPTNLHNRYLNIAMSFVNTYIKKSKTTLKFQILDKLWPVNLISNQRRALLCGGFPAFAKEQSLQAGDVCVFELIDRDDHVLKVSIFRNMN